MSHDGSQMALAAVGEGAACERGPGLSAPAVRRSLPSHVRDCRDSLFVDADRHGPRLPALLLAAVPALAFVLLALVLSTLLPWRAIVLDRLSASAADVVLLAPVLAALVVLAAALAPLSRIPAPPLVLTGCALLGFSSLVVADGRLVAATTPAAIGATLLGLAAARVVRRAVWLLPVLLAAGVSDAQSVRGGITSRLLSDIDAGEASLVGPLDATLRVSPDLVARVDYVVLHVPVGTGTWLLGLVDVLALGLLLGLAHLYWLPLRRTAVALGAALGVGACVATTVPMLPFLGIAWLVVHARLVWRSTRFSVRRLTYLGG